MSRLLQLAGDRRDDRLSRSRRLRLKFGSARLDRSYDLAPQAPRQGLDPRGIVDLDSVNVEHVTSLVEILLGQAHELVVIPRLDDQLVLRPESLVASNRVGWLIASD